MKSSIVSKKGLRRLALASVATLSVFGAANSSAATINATSSATVVTPITIAVGQNMSFGNLIASGTASTITMTTAGGVTGTGVLGSGTKAAARFNVGGTAAATYSISVTDNNLTHTDLATTMALTPVWDLDAAAQNSPVVGTLDGTGAQSIYVGGTLALGINQLAGVYSGTVTATVNYN